TEKEYYNGRMVECYLPWGFFALSSQEHHDCGMLSSTRRAPSGPRRANQRPGRLRGWGGSYLQLVSLTIDAVMMGVAIYIKSQSGFYLRLIKTTHRVTTLTTTQSTERA